MLTSCQRKKSVKPHVRTACVNCKKAHLACDAERPCKRCTSVGKTDSCYDIQHKKRGRPKLREKYAPTLDSHHYSTNTPLYTDTPKRQVPRQYHQSLPHFQPMLPLSLPKPSSPVAVSSSSQATLPNHHHHHHHHQPTSPIDILTPFLTMSPPSSSFIMTKQTSSIQAYDNSMPSTLHDPMMTIFLTNEMCCARASDETMDFIGYHPQELAHRSLYDFISNPTDLHQVHQHLSRSYQQSIQSPTNTVSPTRLPTNSDSSNSNTNDYYHQLPPTTLLNIANGSKTFKMTLYFYTADRKEQRALDARFYFGGALGADLCQPSTLDRLYIVCLLTKAKTFQPSILTPSIFPDITTRPPITTSCKSVSHSADTLPSDATVTVSAPSPLSPPLRNLSLLPNDTIPSNKLELSPLSYLSSSLSSLSSSSSNSSSSSSHFPISSSSSSSCNILSSSASSMMLTPPYTTIHTPSAVEQDESSLFSWLDFAFSSNNTTTMPLYRS